MAANVYSYTEKRFNVQLCSALTNCAMISYIGAKASNLKCDKKLKIRQISMVYSTWLYLLNLKRISYRNTRRELCYVSLFLKNITQLWWIAASRWNFWLSFVGSFILCLLSTVKTSSSSFIFIITFTTTTTTSLLPPPSLS